MTGDLSGAAALVTGGASGLGRATAASLVEAGASVVLVDLPGSPGAEAAAKLGPHATFCPADVCAEDDVARAVATATEAGPLRVVVNCAGVATPGRVLGRRGPLPLDAFRAVVEVNLVGTFNVLRLSAAAMRANEPVDGERGVAVLTASVAAFEGQVGQAAYAASKGGVAALTISAARDLADAGIRVVTIAPGIFETPMLRGLPEPVQQSLAAQVPHPSRLGHPDEYAQLVRHIIDNRYLNGAVIRLDGAVRMAPR
ncbi:SDR family NAD(P)-dependent oxidoreductase [Phytohabitans kaempferiae]|uniref:SDR family NAD(P)-dependent oxidoreductase n=1 Tax=Phytohabitans kaempferiae TaxID=1620943 RepID=A0ABV6M6G7_9ACTN